MMTLYALSVFLTLFAANKAIARVRLSRAKYPTLAGHPRLASWIASRTPGIRYSIEQVFRVDGAPPTLQAQRHAAFMRVSDLCKMQHESAYAISREALSLLPDYQFTSFYRVPFPFAPLAKEYLPVNSFATATRGNRILDMGGNELIDLTGSYGVNLFGNDFYKARIREGCERVQELGCVLGYYHPLVVRNAARIAKISGLDEVSFHMSGTEAVMQAVRLARYHTGRSHLVRFCGAYHGWWGDVQPGPGNPLQPSACYTLRDMDERSLKVLATRRDIACVLVNPLQALHPNSPASSDSALVADRAGHVSERAHYGAWLRRLRDVCSANKIPLIFDEVFTGFRLAPGGAQAYFGVRADLVTYGKTLGGGLPVGVLCGRRHLMQRYRRDHPADICFARGTFNSHPYVMGAMAAFLDALEDPDVMGLYKDIDVRWDGYATRLNDILAMADLPIRVISLGTIWAVSFLRASRYNWLFQYYLRLENLALSWVGTGRLVFSLDFSDADVVTVMERFVTAARKMEQDGWWWAPAGASRRQIGLQILRDMVLSRSGA